MNRGMNAWRGEKGVPSSCATTNKHESNGAIQGHWYGSITIPNPLHNTPLIYHSLTAHPADMDLLKLPFRDRVNHPTPGGLPNTAHLPSLATLPPAHCTTYLHCTISPSTSSIQGTFGPKQWRRLQVLRASLGV